MNSIIYQTGMNCNPKERMEYLYQDWEILKDIWKFSIKN